AELRHLTLSALLLGFVGPTPPRWLLDGLAEGLGGVVLFGSNLGDGRSVDRLTVQLRAAAGRDVVIALDEEGGDVTRLDTVRGSASPGAAALGYLDDPDATERAYAAIGLRLAEAGVTVDLAPVADVNVDPRNPVIGVRSFGADPQLVARHVAAAVRGLQGQGVAACAKHFPGHGATSADSHVEVPTLTRSADDIAAVELPPFAAAIEARARAVMTAHLMVPALDATSLATVSRPITSALLRERLGFTGTVMTDALEMGALADTIGMERGFVAALAAGADTIETGALDYPHLLDEIPAAVQRALDQGELALDRLQDAAARTAELASAATPHPVPPQPHLARRCIELAGTIPRLPRPLVVEARPPGGVASGDLPWSLADELAARVPGTTRLDVHDAGEAAAAIATASGRGLVVVVRDPLRHQWQQVLVDGVRTHPAAVLVDVGWPAPLPEGLPMIRTRGVAPGLLGAAAELLADSY
ncbi:MAG TPA: glycoside hydrolase family 3 N-terminal domain-containing protein, partial [Jatrophihabitans sp.]|nr:glycoside hydrolase family 3 N-terminal domain-containing protein [Jatrophihabitans sp.]